MTTVLLDGRHFVNCTFDSCELTYGGGVLISERTLIAACSYMFGGPVLRPYFDRDVVDETVRAAVVPKEAEALRVAEPFNLALELRRRSLLITTWAA